MSLLFSHLLWHKYYYTTVYNKVVLLYLYTEIRYAISIALLLHFVQILCGLTCLLHYIRIWYDFRFTWINIYSVLILKFLSSFVCLENIEQWLLFFVSNTVSFLSCFWENTVPHLLERLWLVSWQLINTSSRGNEHVRIWKQIF